MARSLFWMSLLVAVATACSDSEAPEISATATPRVLVGPALVWTQTAAGSDQTCSTLAYDVASGATIILSEELCAITVAGSEALAVSGLPGAASIVGIASSTGQIRPITTDRGYVFGVAVSPDQRSAAFGWAATGERDAPSELRVVDLASGAQRTVASFANVSGSGTVVGQPAPTAWLTDGSGFAFRYDANHGPVHYTGVAYMDGNLIVNERIWAAHMSPDAERVAYDGYTTTGCQVTPGQRMRIVELVTGTETAAVESPSGGMIIEGWSPGGDELLYRQYDTQPAEPGDCVPKFVPDSERWLILSAGGGPPLPVDDLDALRREWYGDRLVDVGCDTEDEWGHCPSLEEHVLRLNGQEIARFPHIEVVGWID